VLVRHQGLPRNLDELFPGASGDRDLDVDLPPGRLVVPQEGRVPAYWLSDEPAEADVWVSLRQAHARSGLWPLLASPLSSYEQEPWEAGDVSPQPVGGVDQVNAAEGLEALWSEWVEDGDAAEAEDFLELEPFARQWPGLAPAARPAGDADAFADRYVSENDDGTSRIMLVPAARGADVLTAVGWHGPVNYTEDMELLSAVLRSWEDRFGARLVEIGFDTLHLSVASPPAAKDAAELLAAEHFAFCPDNIVQGTSGTIGAYAAEIQAGHGWTFWWD
jgi:hypothetical protein